MKYSCVDQVLPSPFQKEQEIMKSPNPSRMVGRRQGWRTSDQLAWSVAIGWIFHSLSSPPFRTRNLILMSDVAYFRYSERFMHLQYLFVSFLESRNRSAGLIFIHAGGEQQVNMCIMLDDYYCKCFFYMSVFWRLLPNTYCILSKYLSHTSNSGFVLNLEYVTEKPYNTRRSEFPLCDLHNREHNCWSRPPAQETVNVQLSMSP